MGARRSGEEGQQESECNGGFWKDCSIASEDRPCGDRSDQSCDPGARVWPEGWGAGRCLAVRLTASRLCQVMSIEEVERILDETQEAVDYQRVGVLAQPAGTITNLGNV